MYERLYGPPLRETRAEDLEYLPDGAVEPDDGTVRNVLLRVNDRGEYEEVDFDPALGFQAHENAEDDLRSTAELADSFGTAKGDVSLTDSVGLSTEVDASIVRGSKSTETVEVQGQNQREVDAIARLQVDMDAAMAQPFQQEEDIEEEYEEEDEDLEEDEGLEEDEEPGYVTSDSVRTHPHTMMGRFGTFPSTISMPKARMLDPVTELLERTSMKHLTEAAEKALGGKGIPNSPSTRAIKGPSTQKHIGLDASQHKMTELEADTYLAAVMPQTYAAVMSTLVEVRKRLGSSWLRDLLFREGGEGPKVLDAGAGGAGAIAWQEVVQAEWDILREEGIVEGNVAPTGKTTVLTGSPALRSRMSRFLDNTTFLPRLPDYVHSSRSEAMLDGASPQGRKTFDLIIAPHTLSPLKEDFRRKVMIENLWSLLDPNGGVLILIEKGIPRGFEAIAGARSLLLDSHIITPGEEPLEELTSSKRSRRQKEPGMIIAPCTNHTTCPMYTVPGLSTGRKDFCHFGQRFIRPGYLQRVLGASVRNHEDVKYSYIAVRRGVDLRSGAENPILQGDEATTRAFEGYETTDLPSSSEGAGGGNGDAKFNPLTLPRIVLPALKRRGHVTMDLCTPSGQLERWTVPKSFSKAAHRDARKSQWGDLWALGAKTRTARSPRLGRLGKEVSDGKIGQASRKKKVNKYDIIMGREGMESIQPVRSQSKFVKREKRTKGGRIWKEPKPLGEDDL